MSADEPSAQTLRRAAEKMRGLAYAATEGPWWFDEDEHCWRLHGVFGRIPADPPIPEQVMNKQILKAPKSGTPYAEYWPDAADAAWITAMHPGVGLLIADMWDGIAERHATCTIGKFAPTLCRDLEDAYYAAVKFLGEEASP